MTQLDQEAPARSGNYGFDKVYLGSEVCKWLYIMKGRLQMEEGAISRLAICLSLGERYAPDLTLTLQEGGKTFPVASLAGPPLISQLLFAFLRQRMFDDGLDPHDQAELERQFQAHLARGMLALGVRVKHLADVGRLVLEAQERFRQSHPEMAGDGLDATPEDALTVATEEEEPGAPTLPLDTTDGEDEQVVGAAGTVAVVERLQSDEEVQPARTGEANSLWGALLPEPAIVAGPKRSTRKQRGGASSRKHQRKRR